MEAAITTSLSQLLGWTELLLLWWESSRAQGKSLILGSGQRAASESHFLTNTLYRVRKCIPKRAASLCPSTSWGARSALVQWGREPSQASTARAAPVAQPKDTQGTPSLLSLPPAATSLGPEHQQKWQERKGVSPKRDRWNQSWWPRQWAIWIEIKGQSKIKKHKMEFFHFDKCAGNWVLLSQCLADAWIIYHSILCD